MSTIDPFHLFNHYYNEARKKLKKEETNKMVISTIDKYNSPCSRVILFQGILEKKILFFTNFKSNKSKEIEGNPNVALLFYWSELGIQIRIRGIAKKSPQHIAQDYWNTRDPQKQLSSSISIQSHKIKSYTDLIQKFNSMKNKISTIICPENWGGYLIEPLSFEFWEAHTFRLHKRTLFIKKDDLWERSYLSP